MTKEQQQLLINASNSMVVYLTPEELESYAEAEQTEKEAHAARVEMLEEARSKNLSGWQDAMDPEEETIIKKMSPEVQEAYRILGSEELDRFSELYKRESHAFLAQTEFMRIAAARAES